MDGDDIDEEHNNLEAVDKGNEGVDEVGTASPTQDDQGN